MNKEQFEAELKKIEKPSAEKILAFIAYFDYNRVGLGDSYKFKICQNCDHCHEDSEGCCHCRHDPTEILVDYDGVCDHWSRADREIYLEGTGDEEKWEHIIQILFDTGIWADLTSEDLTVFDSEDGDDKEAFEKHKEVIDYIRQLAALLDQFHED